jgi:hypothetical protein
MEQSTENSEGKSGSAPSIRRKGRLRAMLTPRRVFLTLLLLFLFWLFFFAPIFGYIGQSLVRNALQLVCTPPALTEERVAVYAEFIRLVENHREYQLVQLGPSWGSFRTSLKDKSVPMPEVDLSPFKSRPPVEPMGSFSPADLMALKDLRVKLSKVGCSYAEMVSGDNGFTFVAFMQFGRPFFPCSPGVIYSMDGRNPNDVNGEWFRIGKHPCIPIKGHWYASRWLVNGRFLHNPLGPRVPLPESFIDHSLDVPDNLDAESATLSSDANQP